MAQPQLVPCCTHPKRRGLLSGSRSMAVCIVNCESCMELCGPGARKKHKNPNQCRRSAGRTVSTRPWYLMLIVPLETCVKSQMVAGPVQPGSSLFEGDL